MNPLEEEKFLKVLCGVPASFQAHTEVGNLRKELLPEIEKKVDEKTVELEFAKVQNWNTTFGEDVRSHLEIQTSRCHSEKLLTAFDVAPFTPAHHNSMDQRCNLVLPPWKSSLSPGLRGAAGE